MKITNSKFVLAAVLTCAISFTSCQTQQSSPAQPASADSVKTRLGDLKFERGFPTEETKKKVFDEIDYQRAVQGYLWAYPAVSFQAMMNEMKKTAGVELNDLFIADNFADSKSVWLTPNDTTIYAVGNFDLGKQGPVVVDIPPGAIVGMIEDFWQRSIADVGLPGPDGPNGGKFLLVPPGYTGEVPSTGYHVIKAPQHNYNLLVRGIIQNNDKNAAVANVKQVKIYPWAERANPKAIKFVSMSGPVVNTLPPQGVDFWALLVEYVNNNPVQDRDLFFMGMLKPLGIEKGKPFAPDARQKGILEEAARIGDAMGRVMLFNGPERFTNTHAFPGTNWHWVFLVNPVQQTDLYGQIDERLHYTYGAIYTSPALGVMKAGPGGNYFQTFKDKDGNHFDGAKSYKLHVPANVPAAAFWSFTVYDTATRSMLQNPSGDAALSSYDKLKTNADGSIDLYLGPQAPAGVDAANFRQTVPGKGWYPMFRLYTPKEGLFDGTWKLTDIEVVK